MRVTNGALRVAVLHRIGAGLSNRIIGWWSYSVPEFEFERFPLAKGTVVDLKEFEGFDLILYEDGKASLDFVNRGLVPVAYHIVDSRLSEAHWQHRRERAQQADLLLIDFDQLERWTDMGKPVRRFNYCVNDRVFYDRGLSRDIDVAFPCHWKREPKRIEMAKWLVDWADRTGYRVVCGQFINEQYAEVMNRSKIIVNVLRESTGGRPHRVLDVMAARSCLVTTPLLPVSGEIRQAGQHYMEFFPGLENYGGLDNLLGAMLERGTWQGIADKAHGLAHEWHTWAVRARELRYTLGSVYPEWRVGGKEQCA